MRIHLASRRLLCAFFTLAVFGCSDSAKRDLDLLPAEDQELTDEEERLRKMQLITVIDANNQPVEMGASDFQDEVEDACGGAGQWAVCGFQNVSCISACNGQFDLCVAETYLALTRPQAGLVTVGAVQVPEQTEAAKRTLAAQGLQSVTIAADNFNDVLRSAVGEQTQDCSLMGDDPFVGYGTTYGVAGGTGLARAFDVYKQLLDSVVDSTMNTADGELNSTTSTGLAAQRAFGDWRLRAAGELGGTATKLDFIDSGAFCTRPATTPAVRAAIAVIRDAAPPPADILSDQISTAVLINGVSTGSGAEGGAGGEAGLTEGSVRERLARFYFGTDELPENRTVEAQYDLDFKSFDDARVFLKEEIRAFSRSMDAKLPQRNRPDGSSATYASYAATASRPARLPAAYYGALARLSNGLSSSSAGSLTADPTNYNLVFPGFIAAGHAIIAASSNEEAPLSAAAVGPLSMMTAPQELLGFFSSNLVFENNDYMRDVIAYGFSESDGIKLAVSEDDLRCAVQGSIEGGAQAPGGICSLVGLVPFDEATGITHPHFDKIARALVSSGTKRVYLLKPRRGPAMAPETTLPPGSYEAVIGATITVQNNYYAGSGFPIIRGNEERIAALLEPSVDWCARPRVNCDGTLFDERIPLEDELTDDSNGIENSWRHYLDLAAQAAAEADALGSDYIMSALGVAQNEVSVEEKEHQQLQYASQQLAQLQALCGTNVTVDVMIKQLGLVDDEGNVVGGGVCSPDEACNPGFPCVSAEFGPVGRCTFDIDAFVNDALPMLGDSADIQRLRDCLTGGENIPWVSLGDKALCLWHNANNDNLVCKVPDPDPQSPSGFKPAEAGVCPRVSTATPPADPCPASVFTGVLPPDVSVAATMPLNYFGMSADVVTPAETQADVVFNLVRDLAPPADAATSPAVTATLNSIINSNLLDPVRLAPVIKGLDYQARWDDYAAITYNGATLYETGSGTEGFPVAEVDPDTQQPLPLRWPCGPADKPWRASGSRYPHYDCTGEDGRRLAHEEMFAMVAAVKLMGVNSMVKREVPDGEGRELIRFELMEADGSVDDLCKKDCSSQSTLVRPNASGVLQVHCNGGTGYRDASSLTANNLGCFHYGKLHWETHVVETINVPKNPTPVPVDTRKVPHEEARYALGGLSVASPGSNDAKPETDWIHGYLTGQHGLNNHVSLLAWGSEHAEIPGEFDFVNRNANQAIWIYGSDLMMGLGLIARAAGKPPQLPLGQAPNVTSVDDLSSVSGYMADVARTIRDNTASIVFANIPKIVADALRSESTVGSFPQFGGDTQVQIALARGALVRIRQNGPLIANEVTQFASDIDALSILLQKSTIKQQINRLQFLSTLSDRMTQCATAITGAAATGITSGGTASAPAAAGAAFTCANAVAQIGIAKELASLQGQDAQLDGELALADFDSKFSTHATTLQTLGLNLAQGMEDLDAALASIESKRQQARSALASAVMAASFQAKHQAEVTSVLANLSNGKQIRYMTALKNARRLAFLAKRAIEQRLGVNLATITQDYPLVEAPARWESTVCQFTGLDYSKLTTTNANAPRSFSNGFIGDYVTKLNNFVESYRLEHNFHEGTDTAIISLRDDIMNVRKPCEIEAPNLLYNAGQLDQGIQPGWGREGCPTEVVDGVEQPVPDCANVTPLRNMDGTPDAPPFVDEGLARTVGYELKFGTASTATSAVVQPVVLQGGLYRFSWYTKEGGASDITSGGAGAGVLRDVASMCTPTEPTCMVDNNVVPSTPAGGWNRRFMLFRVNSPQLVRVGFEKPASGTLITIAAPMLEKLKDVPVAQALTPFVNTGETLTQIQSACEDSSGEVFRSTRWDRNCVKLCADGYADNCAVGNSKDYCYREAYFGFSQRDIQVGKVFNFSGFARGNFNYRIESVALNMVGTGTRDCSDSDSPQTCYGGGYVPFSLLHTGPFFIRNFRGEDVEAKVFDGNIEHARGLATERYLTNPLSSTDQELIQQFMRRELSGRPLDGNFVLRIWEEDGVDFTALEDVQVVLNYRYWTKFD